MDAFFAFLCVFSAALAYPANDYEGKRCGIDGTCMAVPDCPAATKSLMEHHYHHLERCGFAGFIEIVCCPRRGRPHDDFHARRSTPKTTSTTEEEAFVDKSNPFGDGDGFVRRPSTFGKKSAQVCEEYTNEVPPSLTYQILGGENARLGEFPHMAALGYRSNESTELRWDCGGSLISDRFVLTAAHCAKTRTGDQPVKIRLGKVDISGNSDNAQAQDYNVADIFIHDGYVRRARYHDIALVKLKKRVVNTAYVHPACLYNKNDDPETLIVTGWGATELGGSGSNILQKVTLNPVPVAECNKTYIKRINRNISANQLCARSEEGNKDSCQGDSGGPIQIQQKRDSSVYTIVGVTSFGIGCGGPPGVYTRIYSYLDWIEKIVWP